MTRRSRGFTIVEIAVVVAIISVLATLTVVAFNQVQKSSRIDRRIADVTSIQRALVHYYNDNGEFPTCYNPGMGCPVSDIAPSIQKYMVTVPLKDPTNTDYRYAPGVVPNQYGLLVDMEGSSCKTGTNMDPNWWGSSTSDCKTVLPNYF